MIKCSIAIEKRCIIRSIEWIMPDKSSSPKGVPDALKGPLSFDLDQTKDLPLETNSKLIITSHRPWNGHCQTNHPLQKGCQTRPNEPLCPGTENEARSNGGVTTSNKGVTIWKLFQISNYIPQIMEWTLPDKFFAPKGVLDTPKWTPYVPVLKN